MASTDAFTAGRTFLFLMYLITSEYELFLWLNLEGNIFIIFDAVVRAPPVDDEVNAQRVVFSTENELMDRWLTTY